jgi:hypothetical protein
MTKACQFEVEFKNWFLGLAQYTHERVVFFIVQSLESAGEYILPILCCIHLLMRRWYGLQETKSQVYFLLLCKKADSVIWNFFGYFWGKGWGGGYTVFCSLERRYGLQ